MDENLGYGYRIYRVGPNDTWESISYATGVPVDVLKRVNGYTHGNGVETGLLPGDSIQIPIVPLGTTWNVIQTSGGAGVDVRPEYSEPVEVVLPAAMPEPDAHPIKPAAHVMTTEDALLRYMWYAEWGRDVNTYSQSEAKSLFSQYLRDAISNLQLAVTIETLNPEEAFIERTGRSAALGGLTQQGTNYFTVDQYLSGLSEEQLLRLYREMNGVAQGIEGGAEQYQHTDQFISSYEDILAFTQGGVLPYDSFAEYQPDLARQDFFGDYLEYFGHPRQENITEAEIKQDFFNLLVDRLYTVRESGLVPRDQIAEELRNELGEDFTLDNLMALAQRLAIEIQPNAEARAEAGLDPRDYSQELLDQTKDYYDAVALDNLRKIVYDPAWNPAEEERLLGELIAGVGQMPRNILGVDIGFVPDTFRHFGFEAKKVHDWRMQLKRQVDQIELEMLGMGPEEERPPLWWLTEAILGTLLEPLDWLFTLRDLIVNRDPLALLGFLPLVPSALRYIGRAAQGVGKFASGVIEILEHADEIDEAIASARHVDGVSTGIPGSRYDAPIVNTQTQDFTQDFIEWKRRMDEMGVPVITEGEPVFVLRLRGEEGSTRPAYAPRFTPEVTLDPKEATFLTLLHEEIHVQQWNKAIQALGAEGLRQATGRYGDIIKAFLEKEAYEFELQLAEKLGFSDNFVQAIEGQLKKYWTEAMESQYQIGPEIQDLLRNFQTR